MRNIDTQELARIGYLLEGFDMIASQLAYMAAIGEELPAVKEGYLMHADEDAKAEMVSQAYAYGEGKQ